MDSLKVGIYLILVVSGITLGSPIETEGKNDMQLPSNETKSNESKPEDTALLKRRVSAGDIISGIQLGVNILKTILESIGNVKRKIAIGVENKIGYTMKALNVYFYSGTSDVLLPRKVRSGKALLYNARKTSGLARGCVGVMAYYIPAMRKTLSVMFSVPFDYNLYRNWWDVALYKGKRRASRYWFNKMYYDDPFKGDNGWHDRWIAKRLKIHGSMSSSGTPILEIHVKRV